MTHGSRPCIQLNKTIIRLLIHTSPKKEQETAKDGMTGLQSGNIIGRDPPRTNIKHKILYDLEQTKSR